MDELAGLALDTMRVLWWSVIGLTTLFVGAWLYDVLDPIDFRAEIEKGNVAAAIKMGAVLIGLAAVIATAMA